MKLKFSAVSLRTLFPLSKGEGQGMGKLFPLGAQDRQVATFCFSLTSLGLYTLAISLFAATSAFAFPPAPNGLIYGMVKDQYGTPLTDTGDQIILQTPEGVQVSGTIQPGLAVGVNYLLNVPMDAGTVGASYNANALIAATQYKLYVAVGTHTNLPLEMTGAYAVLGNPAALARQDLTLGVDANGDGIPDSWETVFLSEVGTNLALAKINPNADYAHNGRTLKQEYLLGNYPYNPSDNFNVQIIGQHAGSATLAFTTMTGRSYTAYGSSDLQNWTPLSFTMSSQGPTALSAYYASQIQPVQIQTIQPTNAPVMQFFRLQLQ